jgi:hypothetical protein
MMLINYLSNSTALVGGGTLLSSSCDISAAAANVLVGITKQCCDISLFKGSVAGLPLTCTEAEH